jgi:hypothetical protein
LQTLVAIGAAITTSRLGNVVIGFEELDAALSLDISYELVGPGQDTRAVFIERGAVLVERARVHPPRKLASRSVVQGLRRLRADGAFSRMISRSKSCSRCSWHELFLRR